MSKRKRTTKDFRVPGKVRFSERNPRGKNAEWLEFACSKEETDTIMEALGTAIELTPKKSSPAGTLLSCICREWISYKKRR